MQYLDMTGRPCPIPVIETKKALEEAEAVQVTVDNLAAAQNLEKMAAGMGYGYAQSEDGGVYTVAVTRSPNTPPLETAPPSPVPTADGPTVLITSREFGKGSDVLGSMLMKGFLFSLTEITPLPAHVIFLNGGAFLTAEGADTIDDLKALAERGVEVLTCGTCVNFYGLQGKTAVGTVTDMLSITSRLAGAERLIAI